MTLWKWGANTPVVHRIHNVVQFQDSKNRCIALLHCNLVFSFEHKVGGMNNYPTLVSVAGIQPNHDNLYT